MKRSLPQLLMATCLVFSSEVGAQETAEDLRQRCEEQERQIRRLELENSRLKELVAERESAPAEQPRIPEVPAPAPAAAPAPAPTHTVKPGETLSKIARQHGTTAAALVQLNGLSNAALIRPGQKLKLPAQAGAAGASTDPGTVTPTDTHQVKAGETFYSIARQHGITVDELTRSNPGVNPRALRVGQRLRIGAGSSGAVARDTGETSSASPAPEPRAEAPALTAGTEVISDTTPDRPEIQHPVVRSIRITERITFGEFAAKYGTTTAKLNALNGLNIDPKQTLAEGSELYVSAQPLE